MCTVSSVGGKHCKRFREIGGSKINKGHEIITQICSSPRGDGVLGVSGSR